MGILLWHVSRTDAVENFIIRFLQIFILEFIFNWMLINSCEFLIEIIIFEDIQIRNHRYYILVIYIITLRLMNLNDVANN